MRYVNVLYFSWLYLYTFAWKVYLFFPLGFISKFATEKFKHLKLIIL